MSRGAAKQFKTEGPTEDQIVYAGDFAIVYAFGGPALPTADAGWGGLVGSGLCYAVGIFLHFGAINVIGAARTAMFFNLEPIIAMILAAFLLGESLTLVQYAGGALVIGALVMTSLADRRPTGDP